MTVMYILDLELHGCAKLVTSLKLSHGDFWVVQGLQGCLQREATGAGLRPSCTL